MLVGPYAQTVGEPGLDTARSYLNEEAVDNAIKASGVPRNDLVHHDQAVD